jgi:flagellum-specific peptidoglycan hydrolase FlgJ
MALASGSNQITGSVGRGGLNVRDDVLVVQQLINGHLPIPLLPLKVDGNCGELTIGAIEKIQRSNLNMNPADGIVDPNGATFRFLTGQAPAKPTASSGAFPADVIGAAQASQETWKIPAAVTLAQWALESNWGKAMPSGSNNPFGIKATAADPFVEAQTREVVNGKDITIVAKFRKFASMDDAFDQHGRLLATARPYAQARTQVGNPDAFADALTGVYATDPNYGTALKRIMKTYNLYQYD